MRVILQLLVRQSPPGKSCLPCARGWILLVLRGLASLVLQIQAGGKKEDFLPGASLRWGPSLGMGSWCQGGTGWRVALICSWPAAGRG